MKKLSLKNLSFDDSDILSAEEKRKISGGFDCDRDPCGAPVTCDFDNSVCE